MMEDNKQLALRIDGAVQSASQEVTNLRAELTATNRRLAELSGGGGPGPGPGSAASASAAADSAVVNMENHQLGAQALLREEVSRLQEEVHLLRQMKEMLTKDLEESQGGKSSEVLSATELRVQLAQKEQELARAKEALQAMKADRKRLKGEKTDLVSQMQQLYATLESREEQLRDFIRNYEQHRKESEDAVKALAKEKDLLEREKWELRRQAKEATDHATALRSQLDLKDNRMKELEAELAMAKQSLATLTKDVPKRHSLAMPGETVLNGNQEWVVQADLPLTAAIRQSQQTLYHSHPPHPADRQAVRVSPCHSRQPSVISDASAAEGDRSSTPSDINSPRHRTHSLCNVRPAAAGPAQSPARSLQGAGWRGRQSRPSSEEPAQPHCTVTRGS
ncbi:kazrin isoform X2 [Elephas maximus indicus]|uniref:kazrin isoform X2 n=1 Tax=Elephas maximus indicus TaxID=99487 RepID=UPI00211696F9|nr:kazrin isoform X2 [Elephas maximus indicus]